MRAIRELEGYHSRGLAPEIGLDHVLIGLNVSGSSFGKFLAEVQRNDSIGYGHDEAHVMLDQQYGDAKPVAYSHNQAAEREDFFVIQASRRLVQQQDLRLHSQRSSEFDSLLRAEGKTRDGQIFDFPQLEKFGNLKCDFVETFSVRRRFGSLIMR
jgi:hypothetical protein